MKKYIILIILAVFLAVSIVIYKTKVLNHQEIESKQEETLKYQNFKSGDLVTYKESTWYVMYDSSDTSNYVTIIKGTIDYDENEPYVPETNIIDKLSTNYDLSELVTVSGYKVRLLNLDDLEKLTKYTYDEQNDRYTISSCPSFICLKNTYYATMIETNQDYDNQDVLTSIKEIDNFYEDYQLHLKYYNLTNNEDDELNSITNDATFLVRPIINVYKKYLE